MAMKFEVPDSVFVTKEPTNDNELIMARYAQAASGYNGRRASGSEHLPGGVKELAALLFDASARPSAQKALMAAIECFKKDLEVLEAAQRWLGSLQ